jgi:hypothetical protein
MFETVDHVAGSVSAYVARNAGFVPTRKHTAGVGGLELRREEHAFAAAGLRVRLDKHAERRRVDFACVRERQRVAVGWCGVAQGNRRQLKVVSRVHIRHRSTVEKDAAQAFIQTVEGNLCRGATYLENDRLTARDGFRDGVGLECDRVIERHDVLR